MTEPQLSVIVPAWNEAEALKQSIPSLHAYLSTLPYPFEILVADDGSTDTTATVISQLSQKYPAVSYAGYQVNRGKGGALTHAFGKARGKYQAFIDADLSIDKTLLARELHALQAGADIAIASKHAVGARVSYPFVRTVASYGFTALTRALFGLSLTDFQCGCKAFKREVIQDLLKEGVQTQGFLWDTEVLVKAHRKHYKIAEIPAIVHPDERRSKVRVFRDTWRMFRGLLSLKRNLEATGIRSEP